MRKEHQIILSMYYAYPKNDPKGFPDIKLTKSLDITQLLVMMKGIFHKDEYRFYAARDSKTISIRPVPEKEDEYNKLVDPDKAPYQIINKINKKDKSYRNIRNMGYGEETSNRLYYLNLLINSINGRGKVYDRQTFIHYMLFGSTEDWTYFVLLIKYFIDTYTDNGEQGVCKIINALNENINVLQEIFDSRSEILEDMENRIQSMEDTYHMFENESVTASSLIEEKLNNKAPELIIEFSYNKNQKICQIAKRLLRHVIKISSILSNGTSSLKMPEMLSAELNKEEKNYESLDLNQLDNLLDELETLIKTEPVNLSPWLKRYSDMINLICA